MLITKDTIPNRRYVINTNTRSGLKGRRGTAIDAAIQVAERLLKRLDNPRRQRLDSTRIVRVYHECRLNFECRIKSVHLEGVHSNTFQVS